MTQLSPHFSLAELTVTSHANLGNVPAGPIVTNLTHTAAGLETVRTLLGHPLTVNSGYRSPLVNAAVGGARNSAHLTGHAADFTCADFGSPFVVASAIEKSGIRYDQLIYEQTWVHISFDPAMRMQKLTYQGGKYRNGIVK